MVALWTAYVLLSAGQSSDQIEAYPDEILDMLSHSGIDVEGTRAAWTGRLSSDGLTVGYNIEARNGRALALNLIGRYSFPVRVSSRELQDWAVGTRTGVVAQSYLDGSVYLSERLPIVDPVTQRGLLTTVQNGMAAFAMFKTSFVQPLNGQQVMDQPTIFPPKPAGKLVVDYLSSHDMKYLTTLWGWNYDGMYGAFIGPSWTVAAKIEGRVWTISGPTLTSSQSAPVPGFAITGQFQARSRSTQNQFKKWSKRFKTDQVTFIPDSADVQVSTTVEMKGGLSLTAIKKRILDFVHRAQKLPAADNSVFG